MLRQLIYVSFRNVGRNRRRTLITIITVFIGVFVATTMRGLLNGLQGELRDGLARKVHGDLQIHKLGYADSLEANPYKVLIPYEDKVIGKLKAQPGVQAISPRIRVMAMLNHQKTQQTTPVMIQGISSALELEVCPRLAGAVVEGALLESAKERWAVSTQDLALDEAVPLSEDDAGTKNSKLREGSGAPKAVGYNQIMVSPSLKRGLGAQVGDEMVVLIEDRYHMQQAVVATLVGVVDYGMPNMSARIAWMDFDTLRRAAGVRDEASEIAIASVPGLNVDGVGQTLQGAVGADQVVETYLDLGGMFRDIMVLQNIIFNTILVIVFTIVVSAIVNTSLMTVMERTREIGTLMALGYRRFHIMLLFLCEASAIGIGGAVVGLGLGGTVVAWLGSRGIVFVFPGQAVPIVLRPQISGTYALMVFCLAVGSAVIAAFVPAYRASRMKPVKALASA